jgi:hypothetical protein
LLHHFAQGRILAADQADVAARQIFKPDDILVGCGHAALPEAD